MLWNKLHETTMKHTRILQLFVFRLERKTVATSCKGYIFWNWMYKCGKKHHCKKTERSHGMNNLVIHFLNVVKTPSNKCHKSYVVHFPLFIFCGAPGLGRLIVEVFSSQNLTHTRARTHARTHKQNRYKFFERVNSPSQGLQPTQQTTNTTKNTQVSSGIRTCNPSNQVAANLRLYFSFVSCEVLRTNVCRIFL
jgi:hypothetical protein